MRSHQEKLSGSRSKLLCNKKTSLVDREVEEEGRFRRVGGDDGAGVGAEEDRRVVLRVVAGLAMHLATQPRNRSSPRSGIHSEVVESQI